MFQEGKQSKYTQRRSPLTLHFLSILILIVRDSASDGIFRSLHLVIFSKQSEKPVEAQNLELTLKI